MSLLLFLLFSRWARLSSPLPSPLELSLSSRNLSQNSLPLSLPKQTTGRISLGFTDSVGLIGITDGLGDDGVYLYSSAGGFNYTGFQTLTAGDEFGQAVAIDPQGLWGFVVLGEDSLGVFSLSPHSYDAGSNLWTLRQNSSAWQLYDENLNPTGPGFPDDCSVRGIRCRLGNSMVVVEEYAQLAFACAYAPSAMGGSASIVNLTVTCAFTFDHTTGEIMAVEQQVLIASDMRDHYLQPIATAIDDGGVPVILACTGKQQRCSGTMFYVMDEEVTVQVNCTSAQAIAMSGDVVAVGCPALNKVFRMPPLRPFPPPPRSCWYAVW